MGQSTNGMLVYGYDLGGDEDGWQIAEENIAAFLEWGSGEDGDLVEKGKVRLLASVGFTETDWRADGYHERKKAAEERLGVEFESYCSGDYPMWLLAAHTVTVYRGDCKEIDFAALEKARTEGDWDAKLAHAIQVLGITPTQEKPGWLLVSYWG